MRILIIYKHVYNPENKKNPLSKRALRVVRIDPSFEGLGKGGINKAAFAALAGDLEPTHDSFIVS